MIGIAARAAAQLESIGAQQVVAQVRRADAAGKAQLGLADLLAADVQLRIEPAVGVRHEALAGSGRRAISGNVARMSSSSDAVFSIGRDR